MLSYPLIRVKRSESLYLVVYFQTQYIFSLPLFINDLFMAQMEILEVEIDVK